VCIKEKKEIKNNNNTNGIQRNALSAWYLSLDLYNIFIYRVVPQTNAIHYRADWIPLSFSLWQPIFPISSTRVYATHTIYIHLGFVARRNVCKLLLLSGIFTTSATSTASARLTLYSVVVEQSIMRAFLSNDVSKIKRTRENTYID